jgi:hypothetical protein
MRKSSYVEAPSHWHVLRMCSLAYIPYVDYYMDIYVWVLVGRHVNVALGTTGPHLVVYCWAIVALCILGLH